MAPKQRILWRGLTVLHAGLQSVAAMFSQHSTKAKQNFPMNACMCSTNNKNKEQIYIFFCQLWIRKEVWNNWATLKNPLPQRNSHGQLLLYLRKNNLTSRLVIRNKESFTVATEDYAMSLQTQEHYSDTGRSKHSHLKLWRFCWLIGPK